MSSALAVVERDSFGAADACYRGMVGFLKSDEAVELTESQLERSLEARIRELARQLIQAHLEARGPGGAVRGADGVVRDRERVHERGVETIFGEVRGRCGCRAWATRPRVFRACTHSTPS